MYLESYLGGGISVLEEDGVVGEGDGHCRGIDGSAGLLVVRRDHSLTDVLQAK